MKKWILGLVVLALCAGPSAASSIGIFASSYSPDDTAGSEGVGVNMEFGSKVEFQMRWAVYEDLLSDPKPEVYRIEASPLDLGANYNFGSGTTVTPYVGGGISYVVFDFDGDVSRTGGQPRAADIDPEFGIYVQFGLDFQLSTTWKIWAELLYRAVDAEAESDDLGTPRDQKVSMSGPALNVGLAVQW